jgi:hypothetical protein
MFWIFAVLAIESAVFWHRNIGRTYRLRDGRWERIRLFQARRGDTLRWRCLNGDWAEDQWVCVSDPWFSVRYGEWGVTAVPAGVPNIETHFVSRPFVIWGTLPDRPE